MAVEVMACIYPTKEPPLGLPVGFASTTMEEYDNDGLVSSEPPVSTSALPFGHVAMPHLLKELNLFEQESKSDYSKAFGTEANVDESPNPIGLYTWHDVVIESVLGEGAFSVVFQVSLKTNGSEGRSINAPSTTTHALKCLKAKAVETDDDLQYNAMDLLTEAHILMHTDHPHIISLTGLSANCLGDSYGTADGYFLVLEIMETTLMDTMNRWRNDVAFSKVKQKQLLSSEAVVNRLLEIALPITSAVVYLHQHQIVLRDLKPENVGFDSQGKLKLFDFGLARLVHQLQEGEMAGSVCYMAPEVLLERGACLRSDVYSLAMMIWELVTLELPMAQFQTMEQVQNRVARGHWRPSLSNIPIRSLRNIIKKGWTHKVSDRLSAKEMQVQLRQVCGRGNGDEIPESGKETTAIRSLLSVIETNEKRSLGGGSSSFSSIFRKKKA